MNETTVTFTDEISRILGLGFLRLSQIYHTAAHGNSLTPACRKKPRSEMVCHRNSVFSSLVREGIVGYPIFGIYLSTDSTDTLSLGQFVDSSDYQRFYCSTGATDSSVVGNLSSVEWRHVVPFAPEGASNNVSSYLSWMLHLSSISVSCNQHA